MSRTRLLAVTRKELSTYRRTRAILITMVVLPAVFLIEPMALILRVEPSASVASVDKLMSSVYLFFMITPALLPAVVAAYAVVGERDQGTLEPLLTTPIRREELLLGKALSIILPATAFGYVIFALIELAAHLFAANPHVAVALSDGPKLLAAIVFTPLLAGWSTWVGIAISARSNDARTAQQLGTLASLPMVLVGALLAYNVLTPSFGVAIRLAAVLLVANVVLWRLVSALFDREWLLTGHHAIVDRPS